jgi:hypothetical protein
MAFMVPAYESGAFWRIEDRHGEARYVPCDDMGMGMAREDAGHGGAVERVEGWFYRLSAPGYADCTEWTGPFATEAEARASLADAYECDPDTGDSIED